MLHWEVGAMLIRYTFRHATFLLYLALRSILAVMSPPLLLAE